MSKYKEIRNMEPMTEHDKEEEGISLAMDLAIKQMREGTAPASTVNYFLKLGNERSITEAKKKLVDEQVKLLEAKRESIKYAKDQDQVMKDAIEAIKSYQVKDDYN